MITASKLSQTFSELIQQFRARFSWVPVGKLTFHTFRISSLGFVVFDQGLSVFEAQSISRHAYGSSVTSQIYLAKSDWKANVSAAQKLMNSLATGDVPSNHCGLAATVVAGVLKASHCDPEDLFSDKKSYRNEWLLRLPESVRHAFKSWG